MQKPHTPLAAPAAHTFQHPVSQCAIPFLLPAVLRLCLPATHIFGGDEGCSTILRAVISCVSSHTRNFTHTISFHPPHNSTRRVLLLAPLSRGGNRFRENEWTCQRLPSWRGWHQHSNSQPSDANRLEAFNYIACWHREKREGEQFIFLSSIPAAQKGVDSSATRLSRHVLGPRSS